MSINEPEVVTVKPAITASIRDVVAVDDLASFFDTSFSTIAGVIAAQRVTVTGPAFALYHDHPSTITDVEVGFTTNRAIEPASSVCAGSLPGGRVARAVHAGSYDDLTTAWEQLATWMSEHGHGFGMPFWEVYLTEPTANMNPADLRTELNHPITP
jgi:effector-binding domain-containing protein